MAIKITFPFDIVQSSGRSVEIITHVDGESLIRIDLHPQVERALTGEQSDAVYAAALSEVVKHAMKISAD